MAKLPLPVFYALPDANAIYTLEIQHVVSNGFIRALEGLKKTAEVRCVIPSIVRDEIIARRTFLALKAKENAVKSLSTITTLIGALNKQLPGEKHIRKSVSLAVAKALREIPAEICPAPLTAIKWSHLVKKAVERRPPFTPHTDTEDKIDKGFKDALILECYTAFEKKRSNAKVVLLTKDTLLIDAFRERYSGNNDRLLFSSLDELGSYIRLALENKKTEIAKAIQEKAGEIFYASDNPECLYYKFNIFGEIKKRFGLSIDSPFENLSQSGLAMPAILGPSILGSPMATLTPISEDKLYIKEHIFDNYSDSDGFRWKTRIELAKLFTVPNEQTIFFSIYGNERIRISKIDVIWHAEIDKEGKFSGAKVADYKLISCEMEYADPVKKIDYGLFQLASPSTITK